MPWDDGGGGGESDEGTTPLPGIRVKPNGLVVLVGGDPWRIRPSLGMVSSMAKGLTLPGPWPDEGGETGTPCTVGRGESARGDDCPEVGVCNNGEWAAAGGVDEVEVGWWGW